MGIEPKSTAWLVGATRLLTENGGVEKLLGDQKNGAYSNARNRSQTWMK